jgi:hypothetical protein
MLCNDVKEYISTAKGLPFFYVVGDADYSTVLDELKQCGLSIVKVSDFCPKDDRFPSVDDLIDKFRTSDVDYRDNKFVVVGLGEYLAIKGPAIVETELRRLKNTTLGNARVILLLRGVPTQAMGIINDDKRMFEQKRAFIAKDLSTNISVTAVAEGLGVNAAKGIKRLLAVLENGACGNCLVNTALSFGDSLFPVSTITNAYSALKLYHKPFPFAETLGSNEFWERLLNDFKKCDNELAKVFEKYSIDDDSLNNLYESVAGKEYKNWLFFIYLKSIQEKLSNSYLSFVLDRTENFEDFKSNILLSIIELGHSDKRYEKFYDDRKRLIRGFPESDIAAFVKANEVDPEESIYGLTDNTLLEQKAIIQWVSKYGTHGIIKKVYPALDEYLSRYTFDCPVLADELTEYFAEYKKQKVQNSIIPEFISLVLDYASNHKYARLQTRDSAINAVKDKSNAYLYWIDALGVEYLSYITALAKRKGLSMHVEIARADLPTITSKNKQFFDNWTGGKKYKEERLDDIKHNDKGGYYFTECEYPIHLASELQIISEAIETAATELALHNCKSFVIASDHGASRLAVIKKQEEKYETDTKGEHSGRCCKAFEGCTLEHYIAEDGYIVLSDYGRFKGSRAANVEVHGGATLEEVVVPIITLTLKKQTGITIKVMKPDSIVVDRHAGVMLGVYISDVDNENNVSIILNGKRYAGKASDSTHFSFALDDIRRAKKYSADVYDGSDLIGKIDFTVKGKTGSVNSDFDDLF